MFWASVDKWFMKEKAAAICSEWRCPTNIFKKKKNQFHATKSLTFQDWVSGRVQIWAIRHYIGTIGLIQHFNWFESRSCDLVTTTTISFLNIINTWLKRHSLITSALRKEPRPPSGRLRSTLVTSESPLFFSFFFFSKTGAGLCPDNKRNKSPKSLILNPGIGYQMKALLMLADMMGSLCTKESGC